MPSAPAYKDYRVLRKESKTLGRDILYVGFPMTALDRTVGNAMTRKVGDTILDVVLSYPMNENEFLQWRDAQEVEQASRALLSPYTKVIEKSPVYKTAYDILTQIILISGNISKNCQAPFGLRMKDLSFRGCYIVRCLYNRTTQIIRACTKFFSRVAQNASHSRPRKVVRVGAFLPSFLQFTCHG